MVQSEGYEMRGALQKGFNGSGHYTVCREKTWMQSLIFLPGKTAGSLKSKIWTSADISEYGRLGLGSEGKLEPTLE